MPDAEQIRKFLLDAEDHLQAVVDKYFDAIAAAQAPKTGLARLFQGINVSLTKLRALDIARTELRSVLNDIHLKAALLGADHRALSNAQQLEALQAIQDQEVYLEGFIRALPNLTRAEAEQRVMQYAIPTIRTMSMSAAAMLPDLPHYPGDFDLACHGFCTCYLQIQRVGPRSWNIWWMHDPTTEKHCPDCVDLAKTWTPLMIRDGEIVYTEEMA